MKRAVHAADLLLAVGLALAVRLWTIHGLGFDGLYGQDAFAYYYHGVALWRDHALSYHWPWLPSPTRLYWPLGYPALLAAAFAVAGHASAAAAQAVTLAAGLAVVVLGYALGLRVGRSILPPGAARLAALLAAALIAVSGLQVQASVSIMSDAPALAWGMAALWLWTRPTALPTRCWVTSFLGGACMALAVSTRFEYVTLVPAMAMYWWMARRARCPAPRPACGLAGAVIAGLPQVLYSAGYSAPVLTHQWLTTWSFTHFRQASFHTADGVQHYAHSVGAFYIIRPLAAAESLPWPLAPFLLIGVLTLIPFRGADSANSDQTGPPAEAGWQGRRRLRPGVAAFHWLGRRRRCSRLLPSCGAEPAYPALLLTWWLIPTLYLAGVPFESARFALIAQPPLAILEGLGLVWAARLLGRRARRASTLVTSAALLWAACSLALALGSARGPVTSLARGKASDLQAVRWLARNAPAGSTIATFGLTLMLYHYDQPAARGWRLYDLSALNLTDWADLARAPRLLVVVNAGNLARQWTGLPPDQSFQRLVAERRLAPEAAAGVYTVYG